jgi:hypothetical protein
MSRVNLSSKDASASFVAGNCFSHRRIMVRRLSQFIKVSAYGTCMKSATFRQRRLFKTLADQKIDALSRHRFNLAFENSIRRGYVTEKIGEAFLAGAVPVYWGDESVESILPDSDSIIRVSDFPGFKELGNYLKFLNENNTAYMKHHAWRNKGPPDIFKRWRMACFDNQQCNVCR